MPVVVSMAYLEQLAADAVCRGVENAVRSTSYKQASRHEAAALSTGMPGMIKLLVATRTAEQSRAEKASGTWCLPVSYDARPEAHRACLSAMTQGQMYYSLNSLKGSCIRDYIRDYYRGD